MGIKMSMNISKLIELAKKVRMTDAQKEEQRRSFAFGNTAFENDDITPELVAEQAERLTNEGKTA
jgi:hypothetical protein